MAKAYYIVHWETSNETPESRKYKSLSWFAKVNKLDGLGISRLRQHPERVELYCAWGLLEILASKGRRGMRGWLVRDGKALSADDMAFLTGFPRAIFESALDYFPSAEIGWLELREIPAGSSGATEDRHVTEEASGIPAGSSGATGGNGRKSPTDRQTLQTDRQITEEKKNGAAQLSDNPQQLRTQYAALGELIKELEAISEDDRTPEQVADLKKNRALRRRVQKKQAGLVADRMAA
jgi:hypothetical protein